MFAGGIMAAGGISQRLIDLARAMVGWLPGGMAAVTIVSAMFFAGISGSAAADTAAVGTVLIPAMKSSGYRSPFAAAVQASGGSIGVIIPPSIPMIIFGFLTGASVGRLFSAGIMPGLLMGVSLICVSSAVAVLSGFHTKETFSLSKLWQSFKRALLPLGAPIIILGGILSGVFTATESAAVALLYGLIVGIFIYRQIGMSDLPELFTEGAIASAVVLFIISCASIFTWIAAIEDLPARLASLLMHISDNGTLLLIVINLMLLVAGTFVETTAALILFVPIILPMLPMLDIDLIQFGVIIVTNLSIGMLTPPMGICLIVSSAISKDSLGSVSRAVLPMLFILIVDLFIISFWSPLTMWLVDLLY